MDVLIVLKMLWSLASEMPAFESVPALHAALLSPSTPAGNVQLMVPETVPVVGVIVASTTAPAAVNCTCRVWVTRPGPVMVRV